MSNISGLSSIMSSLAVQGMQSKPDPAEKFKELDTDCNGNLDKIELSAIVLYLHGGRLFWCCPSKGH
jgi:hypothetical protein